MYELGDLLIVCIFILIGLVLWRGVAIREFALRASSQHCQQLGLQLLDQNVARRGLWFKSDSTGKYSLWQSFTFEFTSTGEERYQGRIVVLGGKVSSVDLQPYRLPDEEPE